MLSEILPMLRPLLTDYVVPKAVDAVFSKNKDPIDEMLDKLEEDYNRLSPDEKYERILERLDKIYSKAMGGEDAET